MEFARKQLEKYGWTDGKGLGKNENGISEALKPKLKRSMTGVGHDAAADFNEHWWSTLYDKAASNIEVTEKDGVTKKIKTKDNDEFEITNSTWKLKKKKKKPNQNNQEKPEQYVEYFVRTAVLGSGGVKTVRVKEESESEGEEEGVKNEVKMTDEELFAACGGRTAHKGARHGLKALGKLARIAQQEQLLLQQSKFNGYSHAKKLNEGSEDQQVVEDTSLSSHDVQVTKKKKKKKKHCTNHEDGNKEINENEEACMNGIENDTELPTTNAVENVEQLSNCNEETSKRKKKKKKIKDFVKDEEDSNIFENNDITENGSASSNGIENDKKSASTNAIESKENVEQTSYCDEDTSRTKKKKKKVQDFVKDEDDSDVFEDIIRMALETPPGKVKKKKNKVESVGNETVSENIDNGKKIKKSERKEVEDEADAEEVSKPKKKKKNVSD